MSQSLYWKPVIKQRSNDLDDQLKFILRDKNKIPADFGFADLQYLEGLRDAGIRGAEDLIEAINKHEVVRVFEE